MSLENKSVLVTGGTGFIGSRLVEKLALEHRARVRVLVRHFGRAARIARLPIEMVPGDLTDAGAVQRAVQGSEIIFNCAYDSAAKPDQQRRSGIESAWQVAEAGLREGIRRLVHVSTFAVYAPAEDGDLTEMSPRPKSRNSYVLTKREIDRLLLHLHQTRHLPVVIVQPTLVYGPFSPDWTLGPATKIRSGRIPLIDEGSGYCNLVYIDDVADSMILAAAKPGVDGETFLISGQKPLTWREFYNAFEGILGTKSAVDMTLEEIKEEISKRKREAGARARMRSLIRSPEVSEVLLRLPPVPSLVALAKKIFSPEQWQSVKSRWASNGSSGSSVNGAVKRPLYLPGSLLLDMYTKKTRVRIDRAADRLGYVPKVDFNRGMNITAEFLRWSNLA